MKFKTTALLAGATLTLGLSVYFFDIKKDVDEGKKAEVLSQILNFDKNQINYIEIQKDENKFVLQKNVDGWTILEPIQDSADNNQVEDLVEAFSKEKYLAVAKEAATSDLLRLAEFGLDKPYAIYNFKNNLGKSKKVFVGSQKNFEGNCFVRIDSENRILVAAPIWLSKADQKLMAYREKRLYRSALGTVIAAKIESLQDKFELKRIDNKWISTAHADFELDQNKSREMIKQIAESSIIEYMVDGEPSALELKEKKLLKAPVNIQLQTAAANWSVAVNQSEKENAIYAVTDRPTNLLRLDSSRWEVLGNLNLDSLRDRTTSMKFNVSEVKKIFMKIGDSEFSFIKEKEGWKPSKPGPDGSEFSSVEFAKLLNRIHDLEISEFLDSDIKKTAQPPFTGKNMLILSSDRDNLIFQLNWGPELKLTKKGIGKDYFYARSNQNLTIFAIEKNTLSSISPDRIFNKKEPVANESK